MYCTRFIYIFRNVIRYYFRSFCWNGFLYFNFFISINIPYIWISVFNSKYNTNYSFISSICNFAYNIWIIIIIIFQFRSYKFLRKRRNTYKNK